MVFANSNKQIQLKLLFITFYSFLLSLNLDAFFSFTELFDSCVCVFVCLCAGIRKLQCTPLPTSLPSSLPLSNHLYNLKYCIGIKNLSIYISFKECVCVCVLSFNSIVSATRILKIHEENSIWITIVVVVVVVSGAAHFYHYLILKYYHLSGSLVSSNW